MLNTRDASNGAYDVLAEEAYVVDWVAAACMACLVYEHLITFGQEVQRMWIQPERWSTARLLFFANRYIVEAMIIFNSISSSKNHESIPFCQFYLRWLVCTITVTTAVVEWILLLRVWAIYRPKRYIRFIALFFYLGGVASLIALTITDYVADTVTVVEDFAVMPGCYAASVPGIIAGYWIAPVIVESLFFALIVVRLTTWWKDRRSVPPTLMLLARDSTIYFAVIFVLLITNLFVFEYGPPFLSSLMVTPVNTAGCIAASRMLLNLRALADQNVTVNDKSRLTELRFAPNPRIFRGQQRAHPSPSVGAPTNTRPGMSFDSGAWEMESVGVDAAEHSGRSHGRVERSNPVPHIP